MTKVVIVKDPLNWYRPGLDTHARAWHDCHMTNTTNNHIPSLEMLTVDFFGTLHTTRSCEEFHGPAQGSIPKTSPAARKGIHCADCD